MPPPNRFWVILIGKTATSFKGKERQDLLPTYKQLQRTQSEVSLRWYEGGKIWESPDAAEAAVKLAASEGRTRRPKEWRPGGDHRDPKARFELTRDQKRAKFKRRLIEDSIASNSPFGPRQGRPAADEPADRSAREDERPRSRPSGERSSAQRSPGGIERYAKENPFKKDNPFGAKSPFKKKDSFESKSPFGAKTDRRERPAVKDSGRGGMKPPKRRT